MDPRTEARLLEMLDRQDIMDCLVRYTRAQDRQDRELLLSCYHADAIDDHGAFVGSPTDFFDYYAGYHGKYHRGHHHSISNFSIDIEGDTAHTECYWMFESINADGSMSLHAGRYLDRFEKRNGEWKIAARVCLYEWNGLLGELSLPPELAEVFAATGTSQRNKSDRSYERPLRVTREPQAVPY